MTSAEQIRAELIRAARSIGAPDEIDPLLERPRETSHGDLATNLAMILAKPLRSKPRDVAERLRDAMKLDSAGVSKIEIAGPGFMNFWIDTGKIASGLGQIISADEKYGSNSVGAGRVVNIEFVSANPTGPLHVGHGRQAALGDAIATLLEVTGWKSCTVKRGKSRKAATTANTSASSPSDTRLTVTACPSVSSRCAS